MILHIEFLDGSNPYVFYPRAGFEAFDYSPEARGRAICKEFKRWQRAGYFPDNAFTVHHRGITIYHDQTGTWYIRHNNQARTYKHLGHAIRAAIQFINRLEAGA